MPNDIEIRIPHERISDSRTVTKVNKEEMAKRNLNIHRHEVVKLEDDHSRGERVLKVRRLGTFIDLGRKSYR